MSLLAISFFSLFFAQFLKIFTSHPHNLGRAFESGGMPSSHSAFVSSLATTVSLKYGFKSDIFAIVAVFSLIVTYDASGVRRAVGEQANVINRLIKHLDIKKIEKEKGRQIIKEDLKELIGHTPVEVIFGICLGILLALLNWWIFY